jgi:ABC-type polysaccharide/polyol phosphate export permease
MAVKYSAEWAAQFCSSHPVAAARGDAVTTKETSMQLALPEYLRSIVRHREILFAMALRDVESRHVGTLGGFLWSVVQPIATVAIYWMVFSLGFKAEGPSGMPFALYFMGGFVAWLLFTDTINAGVNAITRNAVLVKKTLFPTEILAAAYFVSASFSHAVLLLALLALALAYGYSPGMSVLAVFYFYAALACFSIGLSWLLGSLQVFHRDIAQVVNVVVNLWFWLTPIVWTPGMLPKEVMSILKWNPIYYVVEGYRGTLYYGNWQVLDAASALNFWLVTMVLLLAGAAVFRRLKLDFADIL